jgi:uncharacterized membrane protein (DUF4010 family)
MSFEETFFAFLVALAAGALIGLERQQDQAAEERPKIGGVRTFPLIALAGALSALAGQTLGVWTIIGTLVAVSAFLTVSFYKDWEHHGTSGITTPIAALLTFLLGVLALLPTVPLDTVHRYLLIIASAAVVMALLSFKEPLHQAIRHVSDDDIYATAKFVILALVVLPLLPNRPLGPFEVLNPFKIGMMVVLIAGLSFLGYITTRILGPHKGLATTGILGGLVSSTGVTVSIATQVKKSPHLAVPGAMAILAASSTMFARILVIVGILNIGLLPFLLGSLGAMTVAGYGMVFLLYLQARRAPSDKAAVTHRNPFELKSALAFGLLYTIVLLMTKAGQHYLGDQGLYASSLLAGTTDVDAITLSITQFHFEGLSPGTATIAITLAAMTNTAVKAILTAWLGGRHLAMQVAPGMAVIVVTGALVAFLIS